MELVEREEFLSLMHVEFEKVMSGEGHCLLVGGEAGFGKTSLVRAFCKMIKEKCSIYEGTCDALFAPRPLGPVFDIIMQMHGLDWENTVSISDRSSLFGRFHFELTNREETTIIIIEDIHWADEATLDFIKFFARRITRLRCLFILTYRDDEIHMHHPLRTVLGQLPHDSFTNLQLTPLSREVVEKLSLNRGYNGEEVYSISGGNPFYVNEILASYSTGIPVNIRDSILSTFNRLDEKSKKFWEILSVLPTGFDLSHLEKMGPGYNDAIQNCLEMKIMLVKDGLISFKHELYRRTIENSLSPLTRIALNKLILDLFMESFEHNMEFERIVHHAKNSNENEIVVKYAPLAAKQAAIVGAHVEASRLYLTAIEFYNGADKDVLLKFYEEYAYECYLTNQIREAIIYTTKALGIWTEKNNIEKRGNCLRFLSRLWWFNGNRKKSEDFANEAIEVLKDQPSSRTKAMAFSNMSQLKMLSDNRAECITWGEKAIAIAKEFEDLYIMAHALNNIGTVKMRDLSTKQRGIELLQQSLKIALENTFHDDVARAYTNLISNSVRMNDYAFANEVMEKGIQYCDERDLDSYTTYLLEDKARLKLETGNWDEAFNIAEKLVGVEDQLPVVKVDSLVVLAIIKMRRGDADDEIRPLLQEAKSIALETMEQQRIIPLMIACLEYEWITGKSFLENNELALAEDMNNSSGNIYEKNEFAFWVLKARKHTLQVSEYFEGFKVDNRENAVKAAAIWKQIGRPYYQALALFEGNDSDKRTAIEIIKNLGAEAVYEKMKFEMRTFGIKNIPRGIRKSTKSNPANLTLRELDVLQLLKDGFQNKEIAAKLFISPKTVDHHISSILFKLDVNTRTKAVQEASHLAILK